MDTGAGPGHLLTKARKTTTQTRYPWRASASRKGIKKTPAEKAYLAEKRKQRRQATHDAFLTAHSNIKEEAAKLHAELGGHSPEWYLQQLMQGSRMSTSTRGVNM